MKNLKVVDGEYKFVGDTIKDPSNEHIKNPPQLYYSWGVRMSDWRCYHENAPITHENKYVVALWIMESVTAYKIYSCELIKYIESIIDNQKV